MSLNRAVKMAALGVEKPFRLFKRVNMCRSSFKRHVLRFQKTFGDSPEEILSRLNISVASSSTDSEDSLREKRLAAVLSDDFNGIVPPKKRGRPSYLTPEEEAKIQGILGFCGDRQCPMDFVIASELVAKSLKEKNVRSYKDGRLVTDPSHHLVSDVLRRGALSMKTPEKLEVGSSGGLCKGIVRQYGSVLSATLDAFSLHSVSGDNVWNLDETGFCMELIGRRKGIFLRIQKKCQKAMKATGDRVSAMFAVSASGRLGPVALVYPNKRLPASFILSTKEICPHWMIYGNDKGWFGIVEFMRYIDAFANYLDTFRPPERHDILVLDNLAVHTNPDVLKKMDSRRLHPVFLPPRATSYLQPLDVCLYGPLKTYFYRARDRAIGDAILQQLETYPNLPADFVIALPKLTVWDIPKFIQPGVAIVFQPERIHNAFFTCGIFPFRVEKMLSRLPAWTPETADSASGQRRQRNSEVMIPVAQAGEDESIEAYSRRLAARMGTHADQSASGV